MGTTWFHLSENKKGFNVKFLADTFGINSS